MSVRAEVDVVMEGEEHPQFLRLLRWEHEGTEHVSVTIRSKIGENLGDVEVPLDDLRRAVNTLLMARRG